MHVCLTSIELFGLGIYGGFGRATRFIGRELVRRGVQVTIVVSRRTRESPDQFDLDGATVHQFDPRMPWTAMSLFRSLRADVYHSQDTSMNTYLASKAVPEQRHVVTFRDPLDARDWKSETELSGHSRLGWWGYRLYVDNPLVHRAVRRADAHYCAAEFMIPKVVAMYGLDSAPNFLPTPVAVPGAVSKAGHPTVCFVSRWDPRKRPERFLALAREFSSVDFIAVGGSRNEKRDRSLRRLAAEIPNLCLPGIINQFNSDELYSILSRSWVLVNTSPREGLPNAFLEAAAHRCAILSHSDPDGFASRFGACVPEGELASGLDGLLAGDHWKQRGQRGHEFVRQVFAVEPAMHAHLQAYEQVLEGGRG